MATTTAPKWRKTETGFRSDDGFVITFVGTTMQMGHKMYNLTAPNGKHSTAVMHSSLADCKAMTAYYRNHADVWMGAEGNTFH